MIGVDTTTAAFAAQVRTIVNDATRALNAVTGVSSLLPDNSVTLGRYADGHLTTANQAVLAAVPSNQPIVALISAGVDALLSAACTTRTAVATAGEAAEALAGDLTSVPAFAAAIQAMTEAARSATNDPADQIRLLSTLASFTVPTITGQSPINMAIAAAQTATAALCRRSALTSLARACASYQPLASDDAVAVLDLVLPLYDSEILVAADAGDKQSFQNLRQLRGSVANDLNSRGASLPSLITVTNKTTLPAVICALQLYGDASRADELVRRNNPVHPMFLGPVFEALSK